MINQGIGYLTARPRYSGNEYIQATQISEAKRPEILSATQSGSTIASISAIAILKIYSLNEASLSAEKRSVSGASNSALCMLED